LHSIKCTFLQLLPHCSSGIFFGKLGGSFLGNVPGGIIFEVGRRQIFRLDEAAELTFTLGVPPNIDFSQCSLRPLDFLVICCDSL